MMRHKKGYDFSLNNIILGVVFIFAFFVITLKVYTALSSEKDIETCRASVSTKSIAITFGSTGTRVADPIDLNLDCHTTILTVKKDGVENQDGKPVTKFNEGRFGGKSYEDKLETVIADSLENCWKMFGMGQVDAFSRLDGDKHCIQCYDIIFDKDAKEELQKSKSQNKQTLDGFNQFLVSNIGSNKETYAKYLYNVEGPDEAKEFAKDSSPLDINQQYAIIYYSARGNSIADTAAKVGKIVGCPSHGIPIKSFLGPFRKIVKVVDFVTPTCLGAKVFGFAIQGITDAFTHQVGVIYTPIGQLKDQCARLD